MATVECQHLEKIYPGGVRALDDCSMRVEDAELVVLVGPSGCGKSTLLRIVAGLEQATSGTIRIGDRVADGLSPQQRNVAMVFQDYALYPHMSVRRNLEYPLRMRRLGRDERARRIAWVAELLQIGPVLERLPRELSGGQRQRVAMGRALVREPAVSLLDEPLSNLDAKLRSDVRAEIADLQRRTGTTMIYVTHDQTEAMTLGQRVAVLDRGVLRQLAAPRTLYDNPADAFVASFIGSPPMNLFTTTVSADGSGAVFVTVGDQRVSLPVSPRARAALHAVFDKRIRAGVRPEHVHVAETEEDGAVTGTVEHVESLGHETLLKVSLAGAALTARVPGMSRLVRGDRVRMRLDPNRIHFFDEGGLAIAGD
jgi:multiple sugar transport system ATP-binding protein